jgi:hypothetical protein
VATDDVASPDANSVLFGDEDRITELPRDSPYVSPSVQPREIKNPLRNFSAALWQRKQTVW